MFNYVWSLNDLSIILISDSESDSNIKNPSPSEEYPEPKKI